MSRLAAISQTSGRRLPQVRIETPSMGVPSALAAYLCLLLLIPAQLIVRPLGAEGTPAALLAIGLLLWWVCARAGGLVATQFSPMKLAFGGFALALLAAYASGMTTGWYSPANIHKATDDVYDLIPPNPGELRAAMINAADRGLLSMLAWAGVVLICLDGLRSWKDIDRVLAWLVRLATVIAVIGIVQFFTGLEIASYFHIPGLEANTADYGTILARSVLRRVYATATHPIEFGVVLASIFPLALHRALFAGRRRAWLAPVLVGTAAMMSVSRSAVLVMAIAVVVLFIGWPPPWRRRALWVFPLSAVILRLFVPGLLGTMLSMFRNLSGDPSTTGRTDDFAGLPALIQGHLIFGRGQFTFVPRYYRIMDNQLLVSAIELGILGLTALVALFAVGYLCARGVRRRARAVEHAHLGLAMSGSILGLFVSYGTFDALGFPMSAGVTFLLLGICGAAWQVAAREQAAVR